MPPPNTASKYINGFDPRTIEGLLLWVDGQDPAGNGTIPSNGATVSTWVDKSGNGRNMTATGSPTYNTTTKGINVGGSAYFGNTASALTTSVMTVFIVFSRTGTSTAPAFSFNLTTTASGFYPNALLAGTTVNIRDDLIYTQGLAGSLPTDNIFVATVQYDNTNNILLWINGNNWFIWPSVSIGGTLTRSGFYLGYQGGTKYFTGNYFEVLVYNNPVSLALKQEIEGYLEYKWKLNFPTNTFSPTSVANCMLWFDANDTSSVQVNGEYRVTQWNDKSGNNRHATPPNTNQAPYYFQASKQVYFYRASNAYLNLPNGSLPNGNSPYSYFIVLAFDQMVDGMGIIGGGNYGTNNGVFALRSLGTGGAIHQYWWNNDLTTFPGAYYPNRPFLLGATGGIGFARYTYINTFIISGDNPPSARSQGANSNTIGVTGNYAEFMSGYIQEIIVYSNSISGTDYNNVSNYLMNKWGLYSLNSNHPFKLYSTPTRLFQPIDIESCVLWFDGADSTTASITPGTSNLISWRDKSASQTTAIAYKAGSTRNVYWAGNGVYIDNGTVNTGGSISDYAQLTISSNIQNTQNYSVFAVVNYITKPSGQLQVIYANFRAARSPDSRAPNFGVGSSFEINSAGNTAYGFDLAQQSPNARAVFGMISNTSNLLFTTNGILYTTTRDAVRWSTDGQGLPTMGATVDVASGTGGDGRYATGTIHELILYNQAVSTNERLIIEAYLANKWGLSGLMAGSASSTLTLQPDDASISSSLRFWNDATSYSTNNQTLTSWINKGNSGVTPTCTGSPTVLTGQLNGNPIVRFTTSSTWATGTLNYTSYTMFFVGRQRGGTNRRILQSGTTNQLFGYWAGRKRVLYIEANPSLLTGNASDSAWDIFSHSRTVGGQYTMLWNGVVIYGELQSTNTSLDNLVINTGAIGGESSDCDVAEIIVYNTVLTLQQQRAIIQSLSTKWGIALDTPTQPYTLSYLPDTTPFTPALYAYPNGGSIQNLYCVFYDITQSNPSINPSGTGWGTQLKGTPGYYNPINFQDGDSRVGLSDFVGIVCTGWVYSANGGTIQFRIVVDDGGYLIFNGVPVITNAWILQGDTGYNTGYLNLNPGFNSIQFRFFEWGGGMTCELYYALNYSGTWLSDATSVFYGTPCILACWYDSADATTVSLSQNNGILAQWADKSGTGYHMNQRLTNGPTYTLASRTIRFNNNRDLVMPTRALNNAARWTMIFMFNPISSLNWIVTKQRDGVNSYNILSMTNYNGGGGTNTAGSTGFLYFRATNAGSLASSGTALSTNTNQIITMTYDGTSLFMYRNGTLMSTTTGNFIMANDIDANASYMGVWFPGNTYQNSTSTDFIMYEFMFFNSDLSLPAGQRIEGYLAWKWGLVASLPASHPYKKIRP